ncbi:hypothetical protein C8J57DRAFT_1319487, partial [Mycena rebaudengoi]
IFDQPALEHLSRLSSVRHLRLGALPPALPATTSHNDALFSSLRTLYFSSEIESPTRFLEWGNKLPLVEFTAECPAFSTADEVHRLFSAAASGMSHLPLTEFAFDNGFDSFDSLDSANYLIRPQSLRSLFCFVNLASVSVLSPVGIDLDDTTVTDMARSWRHIERLEYCPRLTKLSITFNATVIPISQTDLPMPLKCLKNLDVEASPISTALPVARFLARIFPSLNKISTLCDSLDGADDWEAQVGPEALQYDRQWMEVTSMLHSSATHRD